MRTFIRSAAAAALAALVLVPGTASAEYAERPDDPRPQVTRAVAVQDYASSRAAIRRSLIDQFAALNRIGDHIDAVSVELAFTAGTSRQDPRLSAEYAELIMRRRDLTERVEVLTTTVMSFNRPDGEIGRWEKFGLDYAVFPVAEVTEYIDSWGSRRSGGRRHKGTDILAPKGTPLVAIEDGTVGRIASHGLGGLTVYFHGASGSRYYYAHLDTYAPGLVEGQSLSAGEPIGTVGDTGNARGTDHLHFQWAPDGDNGWVNPYPLLEAIWRTERGDAPHTRAPLTP